MPGFIAQGEGDGKATEAELQKVYDQKIEEYILYIHAEKQRFVFSGEQKKKLTIFNIRLLLSDLSSFLSKY